MTVLQDAPTAAPWWPDLVLAPEPVLPPDPDADLVPVLHSEPDAWDEVTVYDLVDEADRADLDRLVRLDEIAALAEAAARDQTARLDRREQLHRQHATPAPRGQHPVAGPSDPAFAVARVADGADDAGEQLGLVEAVTALAGIDPQALDGAGRVDLIRGWERVAAMVAGEQQLALASVAEATSAFGLRGMEARHEVGAALRLAPGTAAERTEVSLALTERLGDTLAALRRGDVSWRQAADLATGVRDLPDPLAAKVQARVLPPMAGRTAAESRRAVQAAVVTVDPDGAVRRAVKAARSRRIDRLGQPDAMASWAMSVPAHVEVDMWAEVTRQARARKKARAALGLPAVGLDALRVDTVVDALLGPGTADRLMPEPDPSDADHRDTDHSDGTGRADESDSNSSVARADALDTDADSSPVPADALDTDANSSPVPADALDTGALVDGRDALGVTGRYEAAADEAAADAAELDLLRASNCDRSPYVPTCTCGGRQVAAVVVDLPTVLTLADNPGMIPGYGTVPAALARAMATDRDWVRWVIDPGTRQVIDRGGDTYRPSDKMLAFLAARDRTCGFPGCSRRAQDCDCDHVVNYAMPGGRTVAINLGPLCRQHHNAKTHGRWRLSYDPRAHVKTWTSPLGKTYTKGTDPPLA